MLVLARNNVSAMKREEERASKRRVYAPSCIRLGRVKTNADTFQALACLLATEKETTAMQAIDLQNETHKYQHVHVECFYFRGMSFPTSCRVCRNW